MDGAIAAAWAAAMRRRGLADETIRRRLSIVHRFEAHSGSWQGASRPEIEGWLETLRLQPAAMYGTISHLRALYRWARREGLVDANPMDMIDAPRLGRRLPRPARDGDVADALRTTDLTMRACVYLMALGGLRCCEVARLRWRDVDLVERRLWVRGKGDRDRVVAIPDQLAGALERVRGDGPAVIGWSASKVSARVNGHLRAVGAECTAHQLRHRYATRLLDITGDITIVQHALGHASVANTQIYAQVDVGKVLAATARLSL